MINLRQIANCVGASFFVYDKKEVLKSYKRLKNALGEKGVVAFSLKSNYLPQLIKDLLEAGSSFEVSSEQEYNYLLELGVKPTQIVVNAPVVEANFLIKCLNAQARFNLQSTSQWQLIKSICTSFPNIKIALGLRLNLGYKSRFGINEATMNQILEELSDFPNVSIKSLHVHVCEGGRCVASFQDKFDKLLALTQQFPRVEQLNIGGGFYSEMPAFLSDQFEGDIPTLDNYIELLTNLAQQTDCALLIEPGGLLVANAFKFYTKVIGVEHHEDQDYVQVSGSVYDIQPTKSPKQLPYKVISEQCTAFIKGSVVGFTCMEDDVLIRNFAEPVAQDDWIEFTNVGAYAQTLRPAFISSWKPIVQLNEQSYEVLRGKGDENLFFSQWKK